MKTDHCFTISKKLTSFSVGTGVKLPLHAEIPIIHPQDCDDRYRRLPADHFAKASVSIQDSVLCAATEQGGKDSCWVGTILRVNVPLIREINLYRITIKINVMFFIKFCAAMYILLISFWILRIFKNWTFSKEAQFISIVLSLNWKS